MRKQYIIGALLVVMLIASISTAYAAAWSRIRLWGSQYVTYDYYICYAFNNAHIANQRVRLKPLSGDPDLYVYGYRNGAWHTYRMSINADLQQEIITLPRQTYSRYRACVVAYEYPGSYFNLYYEAPN